ncbi:rhodopsin protein [Spatholobus suberectus]|nr:rhodopsin protein [Spatholobus suberectus]
MSYDHQQEPRVGVPPPQGYPAKDPSPPPENPPPGHPPHGSAPQYAQQPGTPGQEIGLLEKCLVALCCCCTLDGCCF